ncbi:MAG: hypothetical protein S4CHLAM81_06920 [Chlamydiales bacterium]|nr:hypothetical protein [Chlamydiales bacterium]MCH9635476.1 hypothetical protein [Chlamydiales bacterium]
MRFAVTPEQKKFFVRKGYITFDELPTNKEREVAQLINELTDLTPLRIVEKKSLKKFPEVPEPIDDLTDCVLLQSVVHGWVIIFNSAFPRIEEKIDGEFLYTRFTKRYLNPEKHPVVYG